MNWTAIAIAGIYLAIVIIVLLFLRGADIDDDMP